MTSATPSQTIQNYQHSKLLQHSAPSHITPKKQGALIKLQFDDINSTLPKSSSQLINQRVKLSMMNFSPKKRFKKLWTKQQDQLLKQLVRQKGAREWAVISSYFDNRCGKQCRQRWHNHLRMGIRKGEWSLEEQWILFLGVQAYGKKWSMISKYLIGRTQNTLKNHWNCKMKPKIAKLQSRLRLIIQRRQFFHHSDESIEVKLINQIMGKPIKIIKQDQVQTIIEQMNQYLKEFQQTKKQIFEKYNPQIDSSSFNDQDKKTQNRFFSWNSNSSFGKTRNTKQMGFVERNMNQSCQTSNGNLSKEQQKMIDQIQYKIKFQDQEFINALQHQFSQFKIFSRIQQNSEEQSESDIQQDDEGHDESEQNSQSNDQYDRYDANHYGNEDQYENNNSFEHQRFSFQSPNKANIFEKMYLGGSNDKP